MMRPIWHPLASSSTGLTGTGHPAHVLLSQFMRIFRDIGIVGSAFHPIRRSTCLPTLRMRQSCLSIRLQTSIGYDAKPFVPFDRPVYEIRHRRLDHARPH
jgi:hypothetical protein